MKAFVRNLMFTGMLAMTVGSAAIAQTTGTSFEQRDRAKYGWPVPTEQARIAAELEDTAFREVTPYQVAVPARNLASPTYRRPAVQTVVREGLTNNEAKRLEATAESRMDHLALAEFYIAKTERLEAQATGYEEAAATYRNGPTVKNLMSPTTAGRYEFFATKLRDEARFSRTKAASHEQMALIASR